MTTYYGQLAAQRLGAARRFPSRACAADARTAAAFDGTSGARGAPARPDRPARRARPFLVRLVDHAKTPADHRLIADLAAEQGRND